mmetsp:Transcript_11719/g.17754  ORF Transcript_11719/g.17754 Transcript_11719/m.17754 type:complete len:289 (-) Transcript_11719:38-904(-)
MSRRLLRSALFCPGDKHKALKKASTLPCDGIVFDLEDAVGPDNKITARDTVATFLNIEQFNATRVVRINCPKTTEWGEEDMEIISQVDNIDAVVLPKVEDIETIEFAEYLMGSRKIPLWTMIETAKGVLRADAIASHPSVHCLVFGSNDLSKDLRAKQTPSREPLLYSMSQCILSARAHGKMVLDGVHMDLKDNDGLVASCVQGRSLGFDGKTLIHPSQIAAANDAYSPSEEEISHARRVVNAWKEAKEAGKSLAVVDGKLVEELHVEQAFNVLKEAELIENMRSSNE